jgi:hypothetical protein
MQQGLCSRHSGVGRVWPWRGKPMADVDVFALHVPLAFCASGGCRQADAASGLGCRAPDDRGWRYGWQVGSITGNTNTVGGGAVWPKANLGDFEGFVKLTQGERTPMIDGKNFNGAKAYKDSKLW